MKRTTTFIIGWIFLIFLISCDTGKQEGESALSEEKKGTYWDYNLSNEARAKDLLSRMTLEEKVSQLSYNSQAIPRLDIPEYNWWNEALHGVGRSGKATVFPQAIGMAASFDSTLIHRVATAISDEARAMYHEAVKKGNRGQYMGLTFWTPNINIFRDARWGRGQETYGEDPWLMGKLGSAFVKGIQGDHPEYLKAAACAKHYVVHSGPEALRHEFNAKASPKDMYETYLPAFKSLVDAGVEGVMCAYNRTNDLPCCGSKPLLVDILREDWGFDGYIVSDCWALADIHTTHNYTDTPVESAALAINNTVNLNCGDNYPHLTEAVEQGLVEESTIDSALKTLLKIRFRLGQFDPPEMNPYSDISADVINSEEHRELAREAAQKSMVLLKNQNDLLPLDKDEDFIFVTGPNAADQDLLLGNYSGLSGNMATILEGIVEKTKHGNKIQYRKGALLDRQNINPIDWSTGIAAEADVTIAVMGITPLLEGEEGASIASPHKGDRKDIGLPQNQIDYIKKLKDGHDKPLVVVLTGGSPIAVPDVHEIADAVLFAWYPGEQGGNAVADVLFGDAVPSGKLPITFPKSTDLLPPYEDYNIEGRTYRYMEKEPLYPFGFGLSYASFEFSDIQLSASEIEKGESIEARVTVTNTGDTQAEEVVQLYLTDVKASFRVPDYSLRGVKRIALDRGESQELNFKITPEMMEVIDMAGNAVIEPGAYTVTIAEASPGPRSRELGAAKPAEGTFAVVE